MAEIRCQYQCLLPYGSLARGCPTAFLLEEADDKRGKPMINSMDIVSKMILVRQDMEKYDKEELWEYYFPEVGASDEELIRLEKQLGFPWDPQYRAFLKHANGWKGFYPSVDLFGTGKLVASPEMHYAMDILKAIGRQELNLNFESAAL